ncbi:hypothetical protein HHK36_000762 [Tetracentron sinense]|uniref:TF-B3 domain-containing protein n=1 Tax=Tetracentron sinense TaxID=13715 RepID=A0A835A2B5_TETSI|nr:hypothetical protein HHK36_000762 [Tetracentron sinense]
MRRRLFAVETKSFEVEEVEIRDHWMIQIIERGRGGRISRMEVEQEAYDWLIKTMDEILSRSGGYMGSGRGMRVIIPQGPWHMGWKAFMAAVEHVTQGRRKSQKAMGSTVGQTPIAKPSMELRDWNFMEDRRLGKPEEGIRSHVEHQGTQCKVVVDSDVGAFGDWAEAVVCSVGGPGVRSQWAAVLELLHDLLPTDPEAKLVPIESQRAVVFPKVASSRSILCEPKCFPLVEGYFVGFHRWWPAANALSYTGLLKPRWLAIKGLPFHLWEKQIFFQIGKLCGGLVEIHQSTISRSDLKWAKIKVCGELRSIPRLIELEFHCSSYLLEILCWEEVCGPGDWWSESEQRGHRWEGVHCRAEEDDPPVLPRGLVVSRAASPGPTKQGVSEGGSLSLRAREGVIGAPRGGSADNLREVFKSGSPGRMEDLSLRTLRKRRWRWIQKNPNVAEVVSREEVQGSLEKALSGSRFLNYEGEEGCAIQLASNFSSASKEPSSDLVGVGPILSFPSPEQCVDRGVCSGALWPVAVGPGVDMAGLGPLPSSSGLAQGSLVASLLDPGPWVGDPTQVASGVDLGRGAPLGPESPSSCRVRFDQMVVAEGPECARSSKDTSLGGMWQKAEASDVGASLVGRPKAVEVGDRSDPSKSVGVELGGDGAPFKGRVSKSKSLAMCGLVGFPGRDFGLSLLPEIAEGVLVEQSSPGADRRLGDSGVSMLNSQDGGMLVPRSVESRPGSDLVRRSLRDSFSPSRKGGEGELGEQFSEGVDFPRAGGSRDKDKGVDRVEKVRCVKEQNSPGQKVRAVVDPEGSAGNNIGSPDSGALLGPAETDPLESDPTIDGEHFGFYSEGIGSPSRLKDDGGSIHTGNARQNLGSHRCKTEPQLTEQESQPQLNHMTTDLQDDEFWPLSGKPYFHCILTKSNVKSGYQLILPVKMHPMLPSALVPVVLTCQNKNWEMLYYGDRNFKRFDPSWRKFVSDNNLKIGDACVFELMECSSKIIKFRVQILNGEIPFEFLSRVNGETLDSPIVIE